MSFFDWHDTSSTESTMSRNTNTTYGLINTVADLFSDLTDDNPYLYNWAYKPHLSSRVEKTEDGYKAQVELPGYNKDSLAIQVENKDLLAVRSQKEGENKQILYRLQLSRDIDQKRITAKTEDGVLFLTLPEAAEHKNKCIKIE
jgi:HSP20 family molecular chaperone IbpA